MFYQLNEYTRAWLQPWTFLADAGAQMYSSQGSWMSQLPWADRAAAGFELFHRLAKDYEKPRFDIDRVEVNGKECAVLQRTVLAKPFCNLEHFNRLSDDTATVKRLTNSANVLVVAPLSGHHATLLRDTVRSLLQDHNVFITDWVDARMVPVSEGEFSLDDYVNYIEDFIREIGADDLHVISVCQPTVPTLAAVSLMAARGEPTPTSLIMMGGPIDTRRSPTSVNNLATRHPYSWFEQNVIHIVPANYPGAGRRVYPGFLQHMGFIAMNPERHAVSHWDFYRDLVKGDMETAQSHRRFYDEYNAVLDMPADYYLDCIRIVFQEHLLPRGLWDINGERVNPAKIRSSIMTIEGELDDISGVGQTSAAHDLCTGVSAEHREKLVIEGAGHYGIFSGRRWRTQVYPKVRDFIARERA